jgi:ribosomal protein S27E
MAGLRLPCPGCGAEVVLVSKASVEAVCAYCRAILVVSTKGLEKIGTVADLHEEATPLQLRTSGKFEGKGFELQGRVQYEWEQGVWSEWYAPLSDGKEAWLAEAQGLWIFTQPGPALPSGLEFDRIALGDAAKLGGKNWVVREVRSAMPLSFEGELPFRPQMEEVMRFADLAQPGAPTAFATISWVPGAGADSARLFIGKTLEFEVFEFQYLRALEGWG